MTGEKQAPPQEEPAPPSVPAPRSAAEQKLKRKAMTAEELATENERLLKEMQARKNTKQQQQELIP
jgi:hypothetical protein